MRCSEAMFVGLCEALAEYIAGYACKQEVTPSDATKMFRKVMSKPGNQDRCAGL